MDDLISRQAAIDALDRIFDQCEEIEMHLPKDDSDRTGYKMYPDYMTVWKYLRQLPSAQGIIRCKDCKYQSKGSNECESWNLCGYRSWVYVPINDDDFCSHAERRSE